MTCSILDHNFGTNPDGMSNTDLCKYVRQLQHTVLHWQWYAARLQGLTRSQLMSKIGGIADMDCNDHVDFMQQEYNL